MLIIVEVNDGYGEVFYTLFSILYMFEYCHYENNKGKIIQIKWGL